MKYKLILLIALFQSICHLFQIYLNGSFKLNCMPACTMTTFYHYISWHVITFRLVRLH